MRPFIRGRRAGRPGPRYGAAPWPAPVKPSVSRHAFAVPRPDVDADDTRRLWLVAPSRDDQPKRPRDLT